MAIPKVSMPPLPDPIVALGQEALALLLAECSLLRGIFASSTPSLTPLPFHLYSGTKHPAGGLNECADSD